MVMVAGANGAVNAVLVNLVALDAPRPQADVYLTLIESPLIAAAFELYTITMVCELMVPESKVPVEPTVPSAGKDHNHPVAAAAVVVATVKPDALYLYFLAPHTLVTKGVIVTVAGATGADNNVLVNLEALNELLPQADV
jgi:hypothetical protein